MVVCYVISIAVHLSSNLNTNSKEAVPPCAVCGSHLKLFDFLKFNVLVNYARVGSWMIFSLCSNN